MTAISRWRVQSSLRSPTSLAFAPDLAGLKEQLDIAPGTRKYDPFGIQAAAAAWSFPWKLHLLQLAVSGRLYEVGGCR